MRRTVLFLSHTSELYGAETALWRFISRLNPDKYRAILVLPGDGPLEEAAREKHITVEKVSMKWWLTERGKTWKQPLSWLWNIRGVLRLASIIRKQNANLVFSNSAVSIGGALAARKTGIPHVWSLHEILEGEKRFLSCLLGSRVLVRFIETFSCSVIVNSRATARPFQGNKNVHLIHNGVDPLSRNPASRVALRREFSFSQNNTVLGTVGKIYPQKGQMELLQAFILLRRRFSGLKLVFIGGARESGYLRKLIALTERENLKNSVVFTGFRRDVPDLLQMVDIVVCPSSIESFGLTVLEGMAAGKTVLAVRSEGVNEVIRHRENGFLVESCSPQAIVQGIEEILMNSVEAEKAARQGRLDVEQKFSLSMQVKKIEKVMNDCFA
ncbi:MAG: glycosyltransferase family 4 protein [Candidatus Aminicenantes bacterium]|nr:glycosyltransferase family 4 protein [Candidatus Aminicenantes bacterium]